MGNKATVVTEPTLKRIVGRNSERTQFSSYASILLSVFLRLAFEEVFPLKKKVFSTFSLPFQTLLFFKSGTTVQGTETRDNSVYTEYNNLRPLLTVN